MRTCVARRTSCRQQTKKQLPITRKLLCFCVTDPADILLEMSLLSMTYISERDVIVFVTTVTAGHCRSRFLCRRLSGSREGTTPRALRLRLRRRLLATGGLLPAVLGRRLRRRGTFGRPTTKHLHRSEERR